jgi:hypothetical protein
MATHKQESGLEAATSLTDISKVIEKLPAIMKSAKYRGFTIVHIIGDIRWPNWLLDRDIKMTNLAQNKQSRMPNHFDLAFLLPYPIIIVTPFFWYFC